MRPLLALAAALVTLTAPLLSHAAPVVVTGALTNTDPVYNRPSSTGSLSGVGTAVRFDVIPFQVSQTGLYTITNITSTFATDDSVGSLYDGPFLPALPLHDIIAFNDDSGPGFLFAFLSQSLTAGIHYNLVVTTFENGVTGDYAIEFSGVGDVIIDGRPPAPAPVPSPWAMMPLALMALIATRRRSTAA